MIVAIKSHSTNFISVSFSHPDFVAEEKSTRKVFVLLFFLLQLMHLTNELRQKMDDKTTMNRCNANGANEYTHSENKTIRRPTWNGLMFQLQGEKQHKTNTTKWNQSKANKMTHQTPGISYGWKYPAMQSMQSNTFRYESISICSQPASHSANKWTQMWMMVLTLLSKPNWFCTIRKQIDLNIPERLCENQTIVCHLLLLYSSLLALDFDSVCLLSFHCNLHLTNVIIGIARSDSDISRCNDNIVGQSFKWNEQIKFAE